MASIENITNNNTANGWASNKRSRGLALVPNVPIVPIVPNVYKERIHRRDTEDAEKRILDKNYSDSANSVPLW